MMTQVHEIRLLSLGLALGGVGAWLLLLWALYRLAWLLRQWGRRARGRRLAAMSRRQAWQGIERAGPACCPDTECCPQRH